MARVQNFHPNQPMGRSGVGSPRRTLVSACRLLEQKGRGLIVGPKLSFLSSGRKVWVQRLAAVGFRVSGTNVWVQRLAAVGFRVSGRKV
jgi:hypothetical protein